MSVCAKRNLFEIIKGLHSIARLTFTYKFDAIDNSIAALMELPKEKWARTRVRCVVGTGIVWSFVHLIHRLETFDRIHCRNSGK